jgi:hypothetical protein
MPCLLLLSYHFITYVGEFIYAGACHQKLRVGSVNVPVDEPSHPYDEIRAAFKGEWSAAGNAQVRVNHFL